MELIKPRDQENLSPPKLNVKQVRTSPTGKKKVCFYIREHVKNKLAFSTDASAKMGGTRPPATKKVLSKQNKQNF